MNRLFGMEVGRPTFVPVHDIEMSSEKIVQIALSLGVCKKQDTVSKLKIEKRQMIQRMDILVSILTAILGIDAHDANTLNQAIGSIQAIAKLTKQHILENIDLSEQKAETITRFFRDPNLYQSPKVISRNRGPRARHATNLCKGQTSNSDGFSRAPHSAGLRPADNA